MTIRKYSSRSQQTSLAAGITDTATSCTVVSGSALRGGQSVTAGTTFTVVIDPDTALEEIVDVTVVSTNVLTITRGVETAGTGQAHSAGAAVRHMAIGRDFRDSNLHAESSAYYNDGGGVGHTLHGITSGEGDVVGTLKTQTLTNKTLTAPTITNPSITGAGVDASIVFEGATADAFETTLTVVDPTQDNTLTLPDTTGTVTVNTATQTLTNKTLTSPVISGSPVITGLSSSGMTTTSATPKDYVDSILGSATAASTSAASAATSATSAATSASSASTSASNALTSANSAATSATAAATSASSASTSASSALTSANSANASAVTAAASVATIAGFATAAATSATSAATSASSALTSANSAATSASTMAASVTAAATSASSAAASATAAASSAASVLASEIAAATSAASASTSATAAATSAASAATSASSALTSANSASTSASSALTSANSAVTSQTAAATSASSASTSATAAATSAASAATSASSAATSYDEFDDRYLGSKSSAPTVDNDGNALLTGALYWNSVSNKMFVWSGSAWGEISSSADIIAYKYTATGGETSKSGADDNALTLAYLAGKEQVYLNGVLLARGSDYTASTGSSITGLAALIAGDILTVLAFTAFSVANTISTTTLVAKGSIIAASAAGTPANLAVGADGSTLVANSAAATGLSWAGPINTAGKNFVINGNFDWWQRGTSFTAIAYTADRWYNSPFLMTITRQSSGAPIGSQYYFRTTATNNNAYADFYHFFETSQIAPLCGQTVTYSFKIRKSGLAGAGNFVMNLQKSATVDAGTGATWTSLTPTFGIPFSSITSGTTSSDWLTITNTVVVPNDGTANSLRLVGGFDTSQSTGMVVDVAQFQLEIGSVATPFSRAGGTIAGELAACQRYFVRKNVNVGADTPIGVGLITVTTILSSVPILVPVTMRTAPTFTLTGTIRAYDGSTAPNIIAVAGYGAGVDGVSATFTSLGLIVGRPGVVIAPSSGSATLDFSSEL